MRPIHITQRDNIFLRQIIQITRALARNSHLSANGGLDLPEADALWLGAWSETHRFVGRDDVTEWRCRAAAWLPAARGPGATRTGLPDAPPAGPDGERAGVSTLGWIAIVLVVLSHGWAIWPSEYVLSHEPLDTLFRAGNFAVSVFFGAAATFSTGAVSVAVNPSPTELVSVEIVSKLAHDLEYLADRSVRLYVRIVLATVARLLGRMGAEVTRSQPADA